MNNIILKCENIKRDFQISKEKNLCILKGISLEIAQESIAVIVGASGAGKSTLLHILGALDKPNEGKVFIDNNDVFSMKDEQLAKFRNKNIGFIFQFHHLLPEFTALENVAIPLMIAGQSFKRAKKRAEEILQIIGLENRANHKPAELSGGENQRIAVARALANNPKIILADEPSGNLDTANADNLHNLFLDLRKNFKITFVIVTHNPSLVNLADKVFMIKDGLIYDNN